MKHLHELSPDEKTRLLAELDGYSYSDLHETWSRVVDGTREWYEHPPSYLTSYDAIIPLVQKLDDFKKLKVEDYIESINWSPFWYNATPSQLCDAVLVATGKAIL